MAELNPDLFKPGGTNVWVAATSGERLQELQAELQRQAPHAVIRLLRGGKCRTPRELFDQMAAVYQLPPYFGENWDALNDCLRDLQTVEAHPHLLIVAQASRLLSGAPPDQMRHFLEILADHHREWSLGDEASQTERSAFHVLLQDDAGSMGAVTKRLESLGFEFRQLE